MLKRWTVTCTALLALAAAAGCGGGSSAASGNGSGKMDVVAAFYPLQFVAERVGGEAVQVQNLAKPGAEPHDLELTIKQVSHIADAGLVVYLHGFQPAVDEAVAEHAADHAFDVATVEPLADAGAAAHEHEGEGEEHAEEESGQDPHVWLDPTRLATIADRLAARLGELDAAHAADYATRARTLRTDLETLDREYSTKLATCERREIVTSHTAFGYLATRYKLEQIGITGLSPDAEPSPQRVTEVAAEAKEHGATTIFFETLVSPKVAETIAREVGAKSAVLDPLEGLTESGADYFTVMRANLAALTTALGCGS
jgi:zinc transport system substrate-binding protein